jgi:hypothetical protein
MVSVGRVRFFYASGYSIALQLARPDERGTTTAVVRLVSSLFGGLIPVVTGALSDFFGGSPRRTFCCTRCRSSIRTVSSSPPT